MKRTGMWNKNGERQTPFHISISKKTNEDQVLQNEWRIGIWEDAKSQKVGLGEFVWKQGGYVLMKAPKGRSCLTKFKYFRVGKILVCKRFNHPSPMHLRQRWQEIEFGWWWFPLGEMMPLLPHTYASNFGGCLCGVKMRASSILLQNNPNLTIHLSMCMPTKVSNIHNYDFSLI